MIMDITSPGSEYEGYDFNDLVDNWSFRIETNFDQTSDIFRTGFYLLRSGQIILYEYKDENTFEVIKTYYLVTTKDIYIPFMGDDEPVVYIPIDYQNSEIIQ